MGDCGLERVGEGVREGAAAAGGWGDGGEGAGGGGGGGGGHGCGMSEVHSHACLKGRISSNRDDFALWVNAYMKRCTIV